MNILFKHENKLTVNIVFFCFRRIKAAKEEISSSEFYEKCIQTLYHGKTALQNIDIVSYGLGQFSQSVTARYQFAFLLILKDLYKAKVFVYDPVFSTDEIEIIKHFDFTVIDFNEEGKRLVNNTTLFFLPHCPKQLTNNLLWKNWNKNLSKCIIIGNSFEKIIESNSARYLKENLPFVYHASSFIREFKLDNCFKFQDIFNDLSLHLFLEEDIVHLTENIASEKEEPSYQENDIEFITQSILHISP